VRVCVRQIAYLVLGTVRFGDHLPQSFDEPGLCHAEVHKYFLLVSTPVRCGGLAGIRKAGKRKLTAIAVKHAPRMGTRLVDEILAALDEQTVVVPGTQAAETILPKLADTLKETLQQRKQSPRRWRGRSMNTLFPGS